jgi:predicted XRE-type DNA-binding protein
VSRPITFLGDSLERLREFPAEARQNAGFQLRLLQFGLLPTSWKSMKTLGPGVREIRIRVGRRFSGGLCREGRRCDFCPARVSEDIPSDRQERPRVMRHPTEADMIVDSEGHQTFENVWDALEDTPAAAANMTMRSDLLIALRQSILSWDVSQTVAAGRLDVTQPRLNDLLRGRIDKFSLDALVNLARRAGLSVRLEIATAA